MTAAARRADLFARRVLSFYPFTIAGTLLFVIAVTLLARSFLTHDPYELVLSVAALFVLLLGALVGRLQAVQFNKLNVQWDSGTPIVARTPGMDAGTSTEQTISGIDLRPFLWFRVHFTVRGRLAAGRDASLSILQEFAAGGEGTIAAPISVPVAGTLSARGSLSIVDIFGLTRSRFGVDFERTVVIAPSIYPEAIAVRVEAAEKTEEKQSQLNSDEDKYYMREYAPGDRFRDINWKTSSRLLQLYTRIAPVAQEQTKIIAVDFRHFRDTETETFDSVMHLHYVKSWLLSFLRTVKSEHNDFQFHVSSAAGMARLQTMDDIERFAMELAALRYSTDPGFLGETGSTDEIYIFTTPYDRGLPLILPRYPQHRLNVFRTLHASWNGTTQRRTVALARVSDSLPIPGLWAFRRDREVRQPGVEHAGVRILGQEVIETKLFW